MTVPNLESMDDKETVPLWPAAARTIHVSQSCTYTNIVLDMFTDHNPQKIWWEHMHCVALSPVTSLNGLNLVNLNESNMCVPIKV